jgi:putative lipoic acid-binding regulatory protein
MEQRIVLDEKRARFEDLMDFPAVTLMRVVGAPGEAMLGEALAVASAGGLRPAVLQGSRASAQGHYIAHHIEVEVGDADALRALYAALKAVPGVRIVL